MDHWTTGALAVAAREGDQRAWDVLVHRTSGMVWAVARSFRLSDADCADVVQLAYLKLFEHLHRLREPDRVGPWLATTARNECLRLLRSSRRTVLTDAFDDVVAGDDGADVSVERAELHALVLAAFNDLDAGCREMLGLLIIERRSYVDVGTLLQRSVGALGPTRGRCIRRLRLRLCDYGDPLDDAICQEQETA